MSDLEVPAGSVVVGVDGSTGSDRALAWAARQADLEHRTLVVLHGTGSGDFMWPEGYGVEREMVLRALAEDGRTLLQRAASTVREAHPDLAVVETVLAVDPRLALLELSADAATVVVGSRGRGPVASLLLGSVSLTVSQHASCPVVVVRPFDPEVARTGILVGADEAPGSRPAIEYAFRQASLTGLPLTVLHCFFDGQPVGDVADDDPGPAHHRMILDRAVAGLGEDYPDVPVTRRLRRGLVDTCLVEAARTMDMVVVGARSAHTSPVDRFFSPNVERLVVEHAPCVVAVVP